MVSGLCWRSRGRGFTSGLPSELSSPFDTRFCCKHRKSKKSIVKPRSWYLVPWIIRWPPPSPNSHVHQRSVYRIEAPVYCKAPRTMFSTFFSLPVAVVACHLQNSLSGHNVSKQKLQLIKGFPHKTQSFSRGKSCNQGIAFQN